MKKRILKIAQFKGISETSRLIMSRTGPYSHSALKIDDVEKEYIKTIMLEDEYTKRGVDNCQLMEQWPHDGNFFKAWFDFNDFKDHKKGTPYEIWELELNVLDWEYCISEYVRMLDMPYDWKGILNFEIKLIKEDPNKTFCSEILTIPIKKVLNWNTVQPHTVHPAFLTNLIQAAGGKKLGDYTV